MTHPFQAPRHQPGRGVHALRLAALAGALLAASAAQAVVSTTALPEPDGSFHDSSISYGNTGLVFELLPRLYVQGLGSADTDALTVAGRNPALQYGFTVNGDGSSLMTIEYSLRNTSAVESFSQLRFMLFANPDGGANFMDTVQETWGAALPGDPARREGRARPAPPMASSPASRWATACPSCPRHWTRPAPVPAATRRSPCSGTPPCSAPARRCVCGWACPTMVRRCRAASCASSRPAMPAPR